MYATTNGANLMNFRNITLIVLCMGLATIAGAEEDAKINMTISVTDDMGDGDVQLDFDSNDLGFDLHEMQEGENRSFMDKSGKSILVTRTANGFQFDVDGKTIDLPFFNSEHRGAMWVGDANLEGMDVRVRHSGSMPGMRSVSAIEPMQGVMIVSEKSIDDATQQAIQSLLETAGYGNEVRFLGADHAPIGVHGFRMIEKTVEVTN